MSHYKAFKPSNQQRGKRGYAEDLAAFLLKKHGLTEKGWTFGIEDYGGHIGDCRYLDKRITFSSRWLHITSHEIKDTILHEIAHALVGCEHAHDAHWRNMARRLGCRPTRCAPPEVQPKGA